MCDAVESVMPRRTVWRPVLDRVAPYDAGKPLEALTAELAELMEEYAEGVDLLKLASEMVVDAIVQPEDLRAELVRRFARYAGKAREWPAKRNAIPPA